MKTSKSIYRFMNNRHNLNNSLIIRSRTGELDHVKDLVQKGANALNAALVESARRGHLDCVKYLVNEGALVLSVAKEMASDNSKRDCVDFLEQSIDEFVTMQNN